MIMSKEITVFNKEEFGEIRSVKINDEPWFAGKDVAVALKYSNPQKAIRDHVDEEDKTVNESFTVNGTALQLINESGVYSLILRSRKPEAKDFKRWVTSEVLPSIRKTGVYHLSPSQQISQMREERLRGKLSLEREKEKNRLDKERFAYLRELRNTTKDEYERRVIFCEMATIAAGRPILPLKENSKTYSAEEIGKMAGGITANMVGRIANANNLKNSQFGIWRTSVVNGTERQHFEYYDAVISEIKKHIEE